MVWVKISNDYKYVFVLYIVAAPIQQLMQCMSCILRKNIYVQLKLNVCKKIVLTNKMIEMMNVFEHELSF